MLVTGIFHLQQQKKVPNQSIVHTSRRGHLHQGIPAALLCSCGSKLHVAAVASRLNWGHGCCREGRKPGSFVIYLGHYVWPNMFICVVKVQVSSTCLTAVLNLGFDYCRSPRKNSSCRFDWSTFYSGDDLSSF